MLCGDDGWGNTPFSGGCYSVVERTRVGDEGELKKWLHRRGVPFADPGLLLPVYGAADDPAVLTTWKKVIKYAATLFSSGNRSSWGGGGDRCLYYHHDGVLTFARDPDSARVRRQKPEHPPDLQSAMTPPRAPAPELPVLHFEDPAAWAEWLDRHHPDAPGVWLRHAKKDAAIRSVSYAEALDVALCYGWIDSQKKTYDESSWIQKWGPRGRKSIWSKINRDKVDALVAAGRMKPAGAAAVEAAKADGRWDAAYDSQSRATVPEDFQAALDRSPRAAEFFATLNGANRYAVLFRVQTAKKPETRAKRIAGFIEMLEKGEKIHP